MKKYLKVILCLCCCFMNIIPMQATSEIHEGYEIIDDNDGRFVYSVGNANNGGWDSSGSDTAVSTEHWSNSANATLEISFHGTKLELYGKKDPSHAMFQIQIDHGEIVECDEYANTKMPEQLVFKSGELASGDHVAKITVLPKRNADSTGKGSVYGVQFVYAKIFNNVALLPSPILYYDFNDETATDKIGQYSGELVNQPTFSTNGMGLGKALDTMQGGYVKLPSNVKLSNKDFTISFFFKSEEAKNDTVLFANKSGDSGVDDGFFLCNYDGLYANVGHNKQRIDTSANNRDEQAMNGAWHHIVVTAQRSGSLSLFVDGELSSANPDLQKWVGTSMDTEANYVLGAGSTGKYAHKAMFDEFKIYDSALSADEVIQLYGTYDKGVKQELEAALAALMPTTLSASMGVGQEMKNQLVKDHITQLLNKEHAGIKVAITAAQEDVFTITLEKGGEKVCKEIHYTFEEKDVLTILTYNIYGWGYPSMSDISKKVNSIGADVVGLQEVNHKPGGGGQMDQLVQAGSYPYSAFKAGYGTDTIWGGSTIVSKYPLTDIGGANYKVNDDTNRSYVKGVIKVGDKDVAIYNTHIVWLEDSKLYAEYKKKQMEELLLAVEQDPTPYKIITGDFNADQSREEFDEFMLHFNGANGWKNTWYDTCDMDASMKIGSVDNIFTTTNIEFESIGMVDSGTSDHDILYANLILKDDESKPLARGLLDNTLLDAKTFIKNSADYEPEGIQHLASIIKEVEEKDITKDNLYDAVKSLRSAMADVEEVTKPIPDPILFYRFEEKEAKDAMQHFNGKLIQEPTFEEGYVGDALVTGNGYVEIDKALTLGKEDFTLSYWYRSKEKKQDTVMFANKSGDSGNDSGIFISNYNGLFANVGYQGSKRFDTSSYSRDEVAMDGEWHFITVSADRSDSLSLYVDGKLSSSNSSFKDIQDFVVDTGEAYVIGAGSRGSYKQASSIDEFKIYKAALDEKQVEKLYTEYTEVKETDNALFMFFMGVVENAIAHADAYNPNEAWSAMMEVYEEAKAVLKDKHVNQSKIDEMAKNLASAFINIRLLPDAKLLIKLEDFLKTVHGMNRMRYSKEDMSFIDSVEDQAVIMLSSKNFDAIEFAKFQEDMIKAQDIIDHHTLGATIDVDANQTNNDSITNRASISTVDPTMEIHKAANQKVNTGDKNSTVKLLFLIGVAGFCMSVILRKHRKEPSTY